MQVLSTGRRAAPAMSLLVVDEGRSCSLSQQELDELCQNDEADEDLYFLKRRHSFQVALGRRTGKRLANSIQQAPGEKQCRALNFESKQNTVDEMGLAEVFSYAGLPDAEPCDALALKIRRARAFLGAKIATNQQQQQQQQCHGRRAPGKMQAQSAIQDRISRACSSKHKKVRFILTENLMEPCKSRFPASGGA